MILNTVGPNALAFLKFDMSVIVTFFLCTRKQTVYTCTLSMTVGEEEVRKDSSSLDTGTVSSVLRAWLQLCVLNSFHHICHQSAPYLLQNTCCTAFLCKPASFLSLHFSFQNHPSYLGQDSEHYPALLPCISQYRLCPVPLYLGTVADMELWRQCARWLIDCRVLPPNHRVILDSAQVCDLAQALRDGVLLCQLLNNLMPHSVNLCEINVRPQMSQVGLSTFLI